MAYWIDPDTCIECGTCAPECPLDAIFASEEDVPDEYKDWIDKNQAFFCGGAWLRRGLRGDGPVPGRGRSKFMVELDSYPMERSALGEHIRALIVASHAGQRAHLIGAVASCIELDLVGVASNGPEALRLCPHIQPDVVVVDPKAAAGDGLALARNIQGRWPWVQVLILGDEAEGRAAGIGFLPGRPSSRHLCAAIRAFLERRAESPAWNGSGPRLRAFPNQTLSRREGIVWRALQKGLSDAQIGERLAVNELTARFYIRNVLDMLGLASREDAIERRPAAPAQPIAAPMPL
jgi:DNA-binding NarL/FixJ family response regulator